ncbi:MAG: carboxypeptidase-like regulatory domain-containing protein [Bacteroidota bacterium]
MTIYSILLVLHIIGGFSALVAGAISIISKKGAKTHKISGLIFFWGMLAVGITAVSISLMKGNEFLLHIGFFSLYMNIAGYRSILDKSLKPIWLDWSILIIAIINSTFMLLSMNIILMVFGSISTFLAINDLKIYYWLSIGNELPKMQWLRRHLAMMLGTYISTFTAFLVVNISLESNGWIVWLAPTFVFTPLIPYWIIRISRPKIKPIAVTIALLTFLSFNYIFAAQNTIISGIVKNAKQQPLSYVNIGVLGTSIGTVSAPDGSFELYLNETVDDTQKIKLSHLGYEDKILNFSNLEPKKQIIISMQSKSTELNTIEINASKLTPKTIGFQKTDTRMNVYFSIGKQPNQNLGASIGKKFKVKQEKVYLDTLGFFIRHNNFDTVRFRINIQKMKQDKPVDFVHQKEIIVELTDQRSGWVEVDLSPYEIVLQENFAASVEWIYSSEKGEYLQMPIAMPVLGSTHYYRFGSQNEWKRFRGMSAPIYLKTKIEDLKN